MGVKIQTTMDGRVLRLKLDDGKANTMEATWVREMHAALDHAEKSAGAVLIEGREGRFSGGLDLKVLPTLGRDALKEFVRDYQRCVLRIFMFPKPIVCAIAGHAIAGGAILALASDRRIMGDGDFQIGLREVAIGIPLPTFGCELARSVMPPTSLVGAVMRGELYAPKLALACGMVDKVVPLSDLAAVALEEAREMARLPDIAFATTKKTLKSPYARLMESAESADLDALTNAIPAAP
jgi:enoyl-CoA hydratase